MLQKFKKTVIALICLLIAVFVKTVVMVEAKDVTSSYQEQRDKEKVKATMQNNCGGKVGSRIDDITSVNSCDYDIEKNLFIYNYDVSMNYKDIMLTSADAMKIKNESIMNIKKSEQVNTYIKNNISLVYNYYSLDRKLIVSIFISPPELR